MKIARCRYWRCPGCQELYKKKGLADLLRRQHEGEEVFIQGTYRCPRCQTVSRAVDVYAGVYDLPRELWDQLPNVAEVPHEARAAQRRNGEPTALESAPVEETEWAILDEEADERETRRRRSRHVARRRGLMKVDTGLAIHYGGMVAFLLGAAIGWLGLFLTVMTAVKQLASGENVPVSADPLAALTFLFLAGWILTALSSVTELVSSAYCLLVPDSLGRKFLAGSIVVRAFAVFSGLPFLLLGWTGIAVLATIFLAVIGWLLWVGFLTCLSDCLDYADLAKEAVGVTLSAIQLVFLWVVVMSLLFVFLLITVQLAMIAGPVACFSPLSFCALIAAIIRYLLASGKFDSVLTLVLYPTGIPVIMRYLDLIGTTRVIIRRRS